MVGVIRTAAAPPGTTAAGLSAPGLEVCGWGNAMVAFWRGQITGNMDMGVPLEYQYQSSGSSSPKPPFQIPFVRETETVIRRNHDNDQKEHEEEN